MLQHFPGLAMYPTRHCVTGSMKRVYDYHRYPISEDLLLGLGRGLGFVYFHQGHRSLLRWQGQLRQSEG